MDIKKGDKYFFRTLSIFCLPYSVLLIGKKILKKASLPALANKDAFLYAGSLLYGGTGSAKLDESVDLDQ
ncbi:hypothetical protein [Sphingobacterium sp.]|uniref:hypothetical protein n=1 Tax=Sphingobacterium sp. TaxID=341027 RepID=UPI002FDE7D55